MRLLLISGQGPENINYRALEGTLLWPSVSGELLAAYRSFAGRPVDLRQFRLGGPDGPLLLRPNRGQSLPHLPTWTLRSILDGADVEYEYFDAANVWTGKDAEPSGDFDVVALSTTFIWDAANLGRMVKWIRARCPAATLVLGGQYSNLKFREVFANHPDVDYIIRGDGELAFPAFLRALAGKGDLADVPNLTWRGPDGSIQAPPVQYVDMEAHPSPMFPGAHPAVPYESMRGCPFDCRFCSFPLASPKWRHKSAEKIVDDWRRYRDENGASVIRALDSTFTVPHTRFNSLLQQLPALNLKWDAYTRANTIVSRDRVRQLEDANCRFLFIGFESMTDKVLKNMSKRVSAAENRRAMDALEDTTIDIRGSFIAGYPGETPEDYEVTHQYVVDRYQGRYNVHFFMVQDETMPVWEDAGLYELEATTPFQWKHAGMDSLTAIKLRERTIREARWKNDRAVHEVWQFEFDRPFLPAGSLRENHRLEKAIDRLAHVVKDHGETPEAARRCAGLLDEIERMGVYTGSAA